MRTLVVLFIFTFYHAFGMHSILIKTWDSDESVPQTMSALEKREFSKRKCLYFLQNKISKGLTEENYVSGLGEEYFEFDLKEQESDELVFFNDKPITVSIKHSFRTNGTFPVDLASRFLTLKLKEILLDDKNHFYGVTVTDSTNITSLYMISETRSELLAVSDFMKAKLKEYQKPPEYSGQVKYLLDQFELLQLDE